MKRLDLRPIPRSLFILAYSLICLLAIYHHLVTRQATSLFLVAQAWLVQFILQLVAAHHRHLLPSYRFSSLAFALTLGTKIWAGLAPGYQLIFVALLLLAAGLPSSWLAKLRQGN